MRGASGWEIESTVGALVRTLGNNRIHLQRGAWRVGIAPAWAFVGLGAACLVTVVAVWVLAARRRPHGAMVLDGYAAVGAVGAFLLCSPLLSPQFIIWLLPFAAIVAARRDRLVGGLVIAVAALSVLDFNLVVELVRTNDAIPQGIVLVRNGLLLALVALCVQRLWAGAQRSTLDVAAPEQVEAAA